MSPKVAIVTGSSAGIGRTTAIALSEAGWNVVLTGRRLEQLQETGKSCTPEGTLIVAGEVTDEDFVARLFKETVDKFGRLDLLFNNAGVSAPAAPFESLSLQTFQNVMSVNVVGPFLCIREAFKVFKAQNPPGGRIINNGSLAAHTPRPHAAPYACSKHAISGLTKSAALEGRAFNITCTQIDIGNAQTSMVTQTTQGVLQPDGRVMPEATFDPKHVADTIVHIASLPNDVAVLEYKIMAAAAPFVGRG